MFTAVFDHAQKLFGRSFFIAAFIPCLLLAAVVGILWWDPSDLGQLVADAEEKGWLKSAPALVVALVGVYLFAYVVYGVRAALHHFYQGSWPWLLGWLSRALLVRERRIRRRRESDCERKLLPKTVGEWAWKRDYGKAFTPVPLRPPEARRLLRDVHRLFVELLRRNEGKESLSEGETRAYAHALTLAHRLQASRAGFPADLVPELNRLLDELRAYHHDHACLGEAARRMADESLRDWREAYGEFSRDFPGETWLQRTRLGNVAAVQELYPLERYGISLSDLWPRLNEVLPEETRRRVEEANIYLDFTVIMSFLSSLGAGIGIFAAFFGPERPVLILVLGPVALVLAAVLFYRLAIEATRAFGKQIQVAVDLYRFKVLDALGIKKPKTPEAEKAVWTALNYFIVQGDALAGKIEFKD